MVVGGGPAGGTAAYELARRGLDVVVLEKEKLPRPKVCAGGLTTKTVQLLDFDLAPVYESAITRGRCTFRGRSPVTIEFGEVVGWTVMRDKFDHLILQQAAAAGAQVLDRQRVTGIELGNTGVTVKTPDGDFRCSVAIGADGANGVVARSVGLRSRRHVAVAIETEIEASPEVLEERRGCVQFDFGSVPRGYGWVFPKKEILSVGVGSFLGKARNLRVSLFSLMQLLGLKCDPDDVRARGHLVPLGGEDRVLHKGRVLLAGDAAGLAEPITGEGIYYAVRSAAIAADVICRALQEGTDDLSAYSMQINADIVQDLHYARRLAALLYRLPRLAYRFFVSSPMVQSGMADVIYGRTSFEQMCGHLLKNAPSVLISALR